MAGTTSTTNMGLLLPIVGNDIGQWGGDLNTSLSTLDVHDHSSGKGIQVPTAGININADLSFGNFNLTGVKQIGIVDNGVGALSTAQRLYIRSGNLWFNDGSANQIQLTTGGGIAGSAGSISGLGSGDSVSFVHATGKLSFNWNAGSNNMILLANEIQLGTQLTFGIGGTPNVTFASSTFNFNNGSTGNGILAFAQWNIDATDNITSTLGTNTFNFNTGSPNAANIKANTVGSISTTAFDVQTTSTAGQIGRLSVAGPTGGFVSIRSNTGAAGTTISDQGSDTNGGSAIRLINNDAAGNTTGNIDYIAYGTGAGSTPNMHRFWVRTGAGTITEQLRITSSGLTLINTAATITATAFISASANPATGGVLRLGNNETISWRDSGNTQNFNLKVDNNNLLNFGGGAITVDPATGNTVLASAATLRFGALFSSTANAAATGSLRLANTNTISWRNAANNADLTLQVDASNNLNWNASALLISSAGSVTLAASQTFTGSAFISASSNPATGGILRLANNEGLSWRNAANSTNYNFILDNNNLFNFGGGALTIDPVTGNTVIAGTLTRGAFSVNASGVATAANIVDNGLTASQAVFTDGSKNLVSNAITGSGSVVMSASPTLTGTVSVAGLTASGTITFSAMVAGRVTANSSGVLSSVAANQVTASTSTSTFSTSSATLVDVTNATLSITTLGRPVFISIQPDGNSTNKPVIASTGNTAANQIALLRGASVIAIFGPDSGNGVGFSFIETPAAGTYTYKLQAKSDGVQTVSVNYVKLQAYEI